MNPYLSEEGSRLLFSGDIAAEFPWLVDYEKVMDHAPENTRTYAAYQGALQLLEQKKPGKGRLLDIGCGSGLFLQLAQKKGWKVEGLDFDPKSIARVSHRYGIPVHEGKFQAVRFQPGTLDVITMWDYLEHVEGPVGIITQVRSLLAPTGVLVIACPNHKSLLFWAAITLSKLTQGKFFCYPLRLLYPITHLSYFDPDFLSRNLFPGWSEFARRYDETDIRRIQANPLMKFFVAILFVTARPLRLSNRFILFFEKNNANFK